MFKFRYVDFDVDVFDVDGNFNALGIVSEYEIRITRNGIVTTEREQTVAVFIYGDKVRHAAVAAHHGDEPCDFAAFDFGINDVTVYSRRVREPFIRNVAVNVYVYVEFLISEFVVRGYIFVAVIGIYARKRAVPLSVGVIVGIRRQRRKCV